MDVLAEKHPKRCFVIALLAQLLAVAVCVLFHRVFIQFGGLVGEAELVGDQMSDPTLGRLAYALVAALACVLLTVVAVKRARSGEMFIPFVLGVLAGIFLWQCVGEDLWNFSFFGVRPSSLEETSALPFALVFLLLLVYCLWKRSFNWGALCMLLSFAVNWWGHLLFEGLYPIFSGLCTKDVWYAGVGLALGISLLAVSLLLGMVKARTPKGGVLAAILCYFATALLVFGMIGV